MSTTYNEGSGFVELLTREGCIEILDIFLRKEYVWLSECEVKELSGLSERIVSNRLSDLHETEVIKEGESTEPYESEKLYALNKGPGPGGFIEVHFHLLSKADDADLS